MEQVPASRLFQYITRSAIIRCSLPLTLKSTEARRRNWPEQENKVDREDRPSDKNVVQKIERE